MLSSKTEIRWRCSPAVTKLLSRKRILHAPNGCNIILLLFQIDIKMNLRYIILVYQLNNYFSFMQQWGSFQGLLCFSIIRIVRQVGNPHYMNNGSFELSVASF